MQTASGFSQQDIVVFLQGGCEYITAEIHSPGQIMFLFFFFFFKVCFICQISGDTDTDTKILVLFVRSKFTKASVTISNNVTYLLLV